MAVSIIFARAIVAEVQRQGFEADALLQHCQIERRRLKDLRETMTLDEADLLTQGAVALTGDPALGLTIGASAPESMLQVISYLMLAQSTLRDALGILKRFSALLADGLVCDVVEHGAQAWFVFRLAAQPGDSLRSGVECMLAMTARIGRNFAPRAAALQEVHVAHREPSYVARYGALFRCPVLFERAHNALVFPRSYLDLPQPHADETVRATFEQAAERLLLEKTQDGGALVQRVRALLCQTHDLSEVRIDRIASQVGLTARSLRRRLGAEGAPFSSLVNEARCRFACEQLRRPDSTIKATAELLGFSETSAFHRAFKRWTGRTPTRLIKDLGLPADPAIDFPTYL